MADDEIATRAPESDAQEDSQRDAKAESISGIAGDSQPDQSAATMGEHCTTDRPTPAGEHPTGEVAKYNDIDVYVSKPHDYPHQPSKLLLLLTGGTGIHSTNNQLQADKYAAEGFLVVMPDQFGGDAAPRSSAMAAQMEENASLLEQVKMGVASVAKSFTIDMWLARHTPTTVLPILEKVIASVKEEFADAVANGGGIYGAGYCFGAKYILLLGSDLSQATLQGQGNEDEEGMAKAGPQIKVGVIAHGTQITKDDMAGMTKPLSVVAVEDDPLFPEDVLEHGKKILSEREQALQVETYPGVPHGFAVFGDYEDDAIKQAQEKAFQQMVQFLKDH